MSGTQVRAPSVLGHAILQLLTRNTASGYDLKKRFFSSLGHGWHAYDTQIYRELKALEANGFITGKTVKGRSGPHRRLYTITEAGRESMVEWLTSDIDLSKFKDEFALRIWTADLFSEGSLEAYLQSAKDQWTEALDHQKMSLQVLNDQYGDPDGWAPDEVFGRQLAIEYSIAVTEAKLSWVIRAMTVARNRAEAKLAASQ